MCPKQKTCGRTDCLYSPRPPHSFRPRSTGLAPMGANLVPKVSSQIRASGRTIRREGPRQNKDPPLNLRRYSAAFGRLTLDLPVVMIAQKMLLVPIIKCCFQEEPGHAEVSHLLETPVGCVHAAAHDGEFTPRHLLA